MIDEITGLQHACQLSHNDSPTSVSICSSDNPYSNLLHKFQEITTPNKITEPTGSKVMHHIITKGPPIAEPMRRLPPDKYKAAKAVFDDMISMGICERSSSPWAAPLHMVRKKTSWRPCGD